jgi:hypothetical protein
MRNILFLVGGAAALFLLSRYRFGQKAVFSLRSIRPGGRLLSPVFNVELTAQNPTNTAITIRSITGNINVKGSTVASVSAFGDQRVAANSETVIKLQARPSAIGIFETVRDFFNKEKTPGPVTVNFNGTANVDGLVVPISDTQTI